MKKSTTKKTKIQKTKKQDSKNVLKPKKQNTKNVPTVKGSPKNKTSKTKVKEVRSKNTKQQKMTSLFKKVPEGRTLSTFDNFLGENKTGSTKERPVVVIETNDYNELAVVPLSRQKGKNRTNLKYYQDGSSYFKHFVEIKDNEGSPIKVNDKFKANHKNQDVSISDVKFIKDKVFQHTPQAPENNKTIREFRQKKVPKINHLGQLPAKPGPGASVTTLAYL